MLYLALSLYRKLDIVAVGTMHKAYALDLLGGEGFHVLLGIAHQTQSPDATTIRERDVSAIGLKLPAGLLVLDGAVIMLKAGIAFLPRLVLPTVLIEARDREPGAVSTRLPGLRIEASSKGIRFGKGGAVALKIVLGDGLLIHPKTKTRIADELYYADGLIDSSVLLFVAIELVLVDKHASCPLSV